MGGDRDKYKPDRPLFVGNFDYNCHPRDLERLIDRYGDIDHIDMKMGFAFVYLRDKRDGDDAIRELDGTMWGDRKPRCLKLEWAKGDGDTKRREDARRKKQEPTTTLFVVNFDVARTREADLAYVFEKFGPTKRVQIKKNFAFVQFDRLDDAEAALNKLHLSDFNGRTITVEYVANEAGTGGGYGRDRREDDNRRDDDYRSSSRRDDRDRDRDGYRSGGGGGGGRSRDRSRSRTPPRRRSRSPDYGRSSPPRDRSRTPRRSRSQSPVRSPRRSPSRSLSPR